VRRPKGERMRACTICGRAYWVNAVNPLEGDDRFCELCAMTACEIVLDLREHTTVGATKDFNYPRWVWGKIERLFDDRTKKSPC